MCGLVGFTRAGPEAYAVLDDMRSAVRHRGPDAEGAVVREGLAFGHCRLAIIELGGGEQPRVDTATGDMLIFNGEIYNFRELAAELRCDGVALRDGSDTEVLFQLLRRDGVRAAIERLNGMFAFAFREGRTGALYLVRDRFGEKPLFYGEAEGALIFASEVTAIREHPSFRGAEIDRDAAFQFLTYEYLPGERSGWAGIQKLPPAHLLVHAEGRTTIERYWRPAIGGNAAISEGDALAELDALLKRSVARQLIADVPLGIFLSGGVDSSLIAALAVAAGSTARAFTVKMPELSFDESGYASDMALRLGIAHEVIELAEADLMAAFDTVATQLDEPLGDSSLLPTYLLCRAARGSMTVALCGDGADELFAGYPNFRAQSMAGPMAMIPRRAGRLFRQLLSLLPPSRQYMSLRFRLSQLSQGFGFDERYQSALWIAPFGMAEKTAIWHRDALPDHPEETTFAPLAKFLADAPHQRGVEMLLNVFLASYLAEDILVKSDRASMWNSLEVRAPFLDRPFAEFAMALPPDMKLRGGTGKYLLKQLASRYIPSHLVQRKKHGFALPLAALLRNGFAERVQDTLLSANPIGGWFERKSLEKLLKQHLSGRFDHSKKLWSLFILFRVAANGRATAP